MAHSSRVVPASVFIVSLLILPGGAASAASPPARGAALAVNTRVDEAAVIGLMHPKPDIEGLKRLGPGVMPVLASLYVDSDVNGRARLAWVMYQMGYKSSEAKTALMRDIRTTDPQLRLQVQWALGRVSNDPDVVDVLLENMQNDQNPLFRDKAACALANDMIFLTEEQKVDLYARLIRALRDPKPQVRDIALKALQIHTGQNKGFDPNGSEAAREQSIRAWEAWLQEYRANL